MPMLLNNQEALCKGIESDNTQLIEKILTQMSVLSCELETISKDVEPRFVQIGGSLQTIYEDVTKLTERVLDSVNVIGDNTEKGLLPQLHRLAEASLCRMDGSRKDISEKTAAIKTFQETLDTLYKIFLQVEKAGRFLRIVAVNIGIESVRSNESTTLFSVVASHTTEHSKKILSVSQDGQDILHEVRKKVQTLYRDVLKGLTKIKEMDEDTRKIVRVTVREIESVMASMLQIAEQAGEHASRISHQVSNLVMAVQFHDSMSQRMEHITKALGDMEALIKEDTSGKVALASPIMKLQAAQLKEIINEIYHVYDKSVRSFEEIINELSLLLNQLDDLCTHIEPAVDREKEIDSFERLRSSFSDLDCVLHQGQDLVSSVRDASFRISETATQVSGRIQEIDTIGFESRLMAMNAMVKAAHLGSEGSALEILAHEVKRSSNQSTSVMEKAGRLLAQIMVAANKLQDQNADTEFDISLENEITEMTCEYNRFMEQSAVAYKQGNEIKVSVSMVKANLDFLPLLAERLTECLGRIEAMIRELPSFDPDNNFLSKVDAENLLNRYTMDKERKIHEYAFNGIAYESGQGTENISDVNRFAFQAERTVDALSENMELFNLESEENRNCRDKVPEPEMTCGKENDLGDNVELF